MHAYNFPCLPENKRFIRQFGCAMQAIGQLAPADSILNGAFVLVSISNLVLSDALGSLMYDLIGQVSQQEARWSMLVAEWVARQFPSCVRKTV